jgi:DNA-binding GntR family transcriptional regulator
MGQAPTRGELENVIHEKIRMLLEERGAEAPAILVAELESALGVDPFSKIVSITSVRTVDDLVGAYLKAYLPQRKPTESDEDLLEAARRARGRRARRGT